MSHELLVVCGRDTPTERRRRAELVKHSADAVPGAAASRLIEMPHATMALVEANPDGGDFAELVETPREIRLHLATSALGLRAASTSAAESAEAGAEAGHVRVVISKDGDVDVSTDGIGFLPCFWGEYEGRLHLSTHLASLVSLGLPAEVDTSGVLQYLVMFHPLQRRTLLRYASLVPPGGHLTWSHRRGTQLTERPLFVPSEHAMSDDEAVASYRDIWFAVLGDVHERNAGSRIVLGLSGGLDSRAIAAGGAALGVRPLSYTYGDQRNRETAVARTVAERLQLPHLTIPVTDDRLLSGADRITARLDGAHGPAEMYESWFADLLRSFADVVVNGLAGGPLWGDDKAVGLLGPAVVLDRTVGRYAEEIDAVAPFLTVPATEVRAELRSDLEASMSGWDLSARSDAVIYWKLANRQLRWGGMLVNALRRDGLRTEAPFLDGRFLRFAARLTPAQRRNGRLYLRAHRAVFPATADIRRSDDGNSPNGLTHVYWSGDTSYASQLASMARDHPMSGARRASRRAMQVGANALHRYGGPAGPAHRLAHSASVFPADLWLRTRPAYAERLAGLLERAVDAHSLLAGEQAASAAAAIRAVGQTASALTLAKVATVGLWLRDYAARAAAVPPA